MPTSETVSKCWEPLGRPTPELLEGLRSGPYSLARISGEKAFDALIGGLRRENIEKPVIYIGSGTCGLGAGAAKTAEAVRAWLKENAVAADLVEVGCVGLCSEEPILDVQLPGRTRVCFGSVVAEKAPGILKDVLAGVITETYVFCCHVCVLRITSRRRPSRLLHA